MKIRNQFIGYYLLLTLLPLVVVFSTVITIDRRRSNAQAELALDSYIENFKGHLENELQKYRDYAFFIGRDSAHFDETHSFSHIDVYVETEVVDVRLFELFIGGERVYQDAYSYQDYIYLTGEESAESIRAELFESQYHVNFRMSFPEVQSNQLVVRNAAIIFDSSDSSPDKHGFVTVVTPIDGDFLRELPFLKSYLHFFVETEDGIVFCDMGLDTEEAREKLMGCNGDCDEPFQIISLGDVGTFIYKKEILYDAPVYLTNNEAETQEVSVGVLYDADLFFRQFYYYQFISLVVVVISTLIIVIGSIIYARYFTKPIISLKNDIDRYKKFMIPMPMPVKTNDEINELAESFSEMTKTVLEKGQAIEEQNKRMLSDLNLARKIQGNFIRNRTDIERMAYYYRPMERVGGDFFEVWKGEDGKIGVFISDVAGHGVPAALVTSMVKSYVYQFANTESNPAVLLDTMNEFLHNVTGEYFVTAFFAIFDPAGRKLIYSNAGHNQPFIIEKSGVSMMGDEHSGLPLGVLSPVDLAQFSKPYFNREIKLKKGTKVLFYTDGLTEAVNVEEKLHVPFEQLKDFSQSGLNETLADIADYEPADFIEALVARLMEFHGDAEFEDDVCLIVMNVD